MTYHMCVIHDTISRLHVIKSNSEEKRDNFLTIVSLYHAILRKKSELRIYMSHLPFLCFIPWRKLASIERLPTRPTEISIS